MKQYDVTLTITHIEASSKQEAIAKAKADNFKVCNAMAEAEEIK